MAKTRFTALQTGKLSGNGKDTTGDVVCVKRVPLSADGDYSVEYLPPCDIIGARVVVTVPYTVTAQTAIRFGTSTDEDFYGQINVSARGVYYLTNASAADLSGFISGQSMIVSVTSVGAAGDGEAIAYIEYIQTS